MSDQEAKLRRLGEGDIVHANSPGGASLICIVLSASNTVIRARRVTTQEIIDFDRRTGRESVDGRSGVRHRLRSSTPRSDLRDRPMDGRKIPSQE